jgi:4-aminobutyrate aminotransferase-like enzyme
LASLSRIVSARLWERAETRGRELHAGLESLVESGAAVAVRSLGLLLAVEFSSAAAARRFVAGCFDRSVLAGWTLHDDRVVRLAPALVLGDEERDIALAAMREAGADLRHAL